MRSITFLPRWLALSVTLTGLVAALAPLPAAAARAGALPRADTVAACAWNKPGHDPFMGDVVAAVDRYKDIPAPVRERLKQRMTARQYDDIAEISRDRIEGRSHYAPAITDMHFGAGRICKTVTRDAWTADMRERGLVYCESGQCLIVPTVCRNVSRVTRDTESPAMAEGPLLFDPPWPWTRRLCSRHPRNKAMAIPRAPRSPACRPSEARSSCPAVRTRPPPRRHR